MSSIIRSKVIHNYLDIISVEKILSCIDINGIVTNYIWKLKGGFLFDPKFNEDLFLMSLFVYWENGGDPKLKEKHQPTLLAWIKNGFSATSKLQKKKSFFIKI